MSDVKCARALMEAANRDIEALRGMADASVFADEIFGFHVQQGAEKLFKAWIALLGKTYPLTHNLAALLNLLADRGIDTMPFQELAVACRPKDSSKSPARLMAAPGTSAE